MSGRVITYKLLQLRGGWVMEVVDEGQTFLIGSIIFDDRDNTYWWHHYKTHERGQKPSLDEARQHLFDFSKKYNGIE